MAIIRKAGRRRFITREKYHNSGCFEALYSDFVNFTPRIFNFLPFFDIVLAQVFERRRLLFYVMTDLDIDPALTQRMEKLGIREEDLEEQFIRGTGPGGQKINKTSS